MTNAINPAALAKTGYTAISLDIEAVGTNN